MNEIETLEPTAGPLDIEALRQQLDTHLLGHADRLVYRLEVDSTNTLAMQLAQSGRGEGIVVLTDSQTAGRGRQGRRWVDISGYNALSSVVLKPLFPPHLLVMIASLAVVDAIEEVCGIKANIKWPNDVLVGDRKVAGILIETSRDSAGRMIAIMGIGINVNGSLMQLSSDAAKDAALVARATTLEEACGHRVPREALIAHLLKSIETSYITLQQEVQASTDSAYLQGWATASRRIRERWRASLSTLGRAIEVRQGETVLSGIAEDVDDIGELLLRRHSGERVSITWGDIGYPTA